MRLGTDEGCRPSAPALAIEPSPTPCLIDVTCSWDKSALPVRAEGVA